MTYRKRRELAVSFFGKLLKEFELMKEEVARHDAFFDGRYCCLHSPKDSCACQKSNIGLLLKENEEGEFILIILLGPRKNFYSELKRYLGL